VRATTASVVSDVGSRDLMAVGMNGALLDGGEGSPDIARGGGGATDLGATGPVTNGDCVIGVARSAARAMTAGVVSDAAILVADMYAVTPRWWPVLAPLWRPVRVPW
jgi:hypothetical protein